MVYIFLHGRKTVGTDGQGFRGLPHALAITLTNCFTKGLCTFTDGVFISPSLRTDTKGRDNFTKVTVGMLAQYWTTLSLIQLRPW